MQTPPPGTVPPGDRGPTRRDATRKLLLESAGTVFAERGYHGTTIEEIIRASGRARATFYNHFGGKSEVFEALTAAQTARITPLANELPPVTPDAAGLTALAGFIHRYFTLADEHARINAAVAEADRDDARVARATVTSMAEFTTVLGDRLRAGGVAHPHSILCGVALLAMLDRFHLIMSRGEIDLDRTTAAESLARWTMKMLHPSAVLETA